MSLANCGIETWVFDLDNTLYTETALYDLIGARMTDYVARLTGLEPLAAEALQERYHADYGATVVGLVRHHGIQARNFLDYVHDVDFDVVAANPELRAAIAALPGRALVYTNGACDYARDLLEHLGVIDLFADIVDIERLDLAAKPQPASFEKFLALTGVAPARAAMFEDAPRNLKTAKQFGFATVLVRHHEGGDHRQAPIAAHVDHVTWDLPAFLRASAPQQAVTDAA